MSINVETQTQETQEPTQFNEGKYKEVCSRRKALRKKFTTLSALEKAEFNFLDELATSMKHDRYYLSKRNSIKVKKRNVYSEKALSQYTAYLARLKSEPEGSKFGLRNRDEEIIRVQKLITKNEHKLASINQ